MSGLITFFFRFSGFIAGLAIIAGGIWLGMGVASKQAAGGAAESVNVLSELDLSSAKDGARGWVSGNITTVDEQKAPISGDQVAWWQTVTEQRYQTKSRHCDGDGCEDRWNWTSLQTDDKRADVELALEVNGETVGVSIPDNSLEQAKKAEGHDPAIWHLEDNDRSTTNESDTSQKRMEMTTTYEYVLREGDGLTLIGEFEKVDGARRVSKIADHPLVVDATFDSYKAIIKDQDRSSRRDIRYGGILLGAGLVWLMFVIALSKWRTRLRQQPEA